MLRRMNIRTKLILTLAIILLVAFTVINLLNYQYARRSVRRSIVDSALPLISNNIYSEIQKDLVRPIFITSLMANDTFVLDWIEKGENDLVAITRYLSKIKDKYGFNSTFLVSDRSGAYYHFKGLHKTVSTVDEHDVWYFSFKKRNKPYEIEVDTDEADDNHLTAFINHRLEDSRGRFLGVTGVGLSMDSVSRILSSYRKRYARNIFLVDPQGLIQAHTDPSLIKKQSIRNLEGLAEISDRLLDREGGTKPLEYQSAGHTIIVLARYIPEFNWFIIAEQDETDALAGSRKNLATSLIIGLVATIVVVILSILAINYFQSELELLATTDKLTGTYNRREFERLLDLAFYQAGRSGDAFSLILADIDGLKAVNDNFGHLSGDRTIIRVAELIKESIRRDDLLFRWGGDEFAILTHSQSELAASIAERIRSAVQVSGFRDDADQPAEQRIAVTLSCGIAQFQPGETKDDLLSRADKALYRAKEQGRNRIEVEPWPETETKIT